MNKGRVGNIIYTIILVLYLKPLPNVAYFKFYHFVELIICPKAGTSQ